MMKVVPSTLLKENSFHKNKTLLQIYTPNENLEIFINDDHSEREFSWKWPHPKRFDPIRGLATYQVVLSTVPVRFVPFFRIDIVADSTVLPHWNFHILDLDHRNHRMDHIFDQVLCKHILKWTLFDHKSYKPLVRVWNETGNTSRMTGSDNVEIWPCFLLKFQSSLHFWEHVFLKHVGFAFWLWAGLFLTLWIICSAINHLKITQISSLKLPWGHQPRL